jgi:hypothetical protein
MIWVAASSVVCWSTQKPYVRTITDYRRDKSFAEANIGESVKTLSHPTSSEAPPHDVLISRRGDCHYCVGG